MHWQAFMKPIQKPITGKEPPGAPSSPHQALAHFYRAFNQRDLALMETNWANTAEIAMDNPLGGITRGWPAIKAVYERLFTGPAEVYVEYHDYTLHQAGEMFYAVGRERGIFRLGPEVVTLAIRTTRIFEKRGGQWQQVHHHGSIDDPQMLEQYQRAVLAGIEEKTSS